MANIRELTLSLNDWETRYILESLQREMERLKKVNTDSEDEDGAADAGNDFLKVSSLYEVVSKNAITVFGEKIINLSSE